MLLVKRTFWVGTLLLFAVSLGCQRANSQSAADAEHAHGHHHDEAEHVAANHAKGHTHDQWWCDEHGVPEDVCGQCDAKVAADFQKRGDWCQEHDRPDSQCFICHPELAAKFAARYAAKFGTQPPKPQ